MAGSHTPAERGIRHLWLDAVLTMPPNHGIDAYAVAVAAALYSYMNAAGLAWPSLRTLADRAKVKQDTVDDRLQRLERAGLLRVGRQHRRTNRYQGQVPAWIVEQLETAKSSRRRDSIPPLSETAPPDGADETAPRGTQTAPPGRQTAPREGSNCPTPAANCPTGWGPTGEPTKSGEPVNGARSGGAPNGAPALGEELLYRDQRQSLINGVSMTIKSTTEWDEQHGIVASGTLIDHLSRYGYTGDDTTPLTTEQARNISEAAQAVEAWLCLTTRLGTAQAIAAESVPVWLRPTLERQYRYLNPGALQAAQR